MLNTKDMSVGSGKARPLMGPGNTVVRINSITLDQTPYDRDAYNINLHMETQPIEGEFEGFFRDKDNESKGRYEGQIGRVRVSPFPFKDTTLPSGREINKDQEILKSMIFLGEVLDKRDELDSIEAETIADFMSQCNTLFSNSDYFNVCLASREWENKEGYINNDLYLPKLSRDGVPAEQLEMEGDNSRLIEFNADTHVKPVVKKNTPANGQATKFEPAASVSGSDFDL
jgi:hypothetical protein|tara:strand:+ start:3980 stop:4666 length:687 start_codon:yes stop_codon:yes gene_type:complete